MWHKLFVTVFFAICASAQTKQTEVLEDGMFRVAYKTDGQDRSYVDLVKKADQDLFAWWQQHANEFCFGTRLIVMKPVGTNANGQFTIEIATQAILNQPNAQRPTKVDKLTVKVSDGSVLIAEQVKKKLREQNVAILTDRGPTVQITRN